MLDLKNAKILITGAAGFIGFHLAHSLLKQGAIICGIDNLNDYYDPALKNMRLDILKKFNAFTFLKIDLAHQNNIIKAFETFRPDYVVHLGAQAGVRYCIDNPNAYTESNLIGQMNILEAIRYYPPKHTIYASSSSVYGDLTQMPFSTEQKTDTPVSLYAATKKSCELLSHAYADMYGLYLTGLRFFTVYGPYGRPDMAYFKFTKKILQNQPIDIYNQGNMMRDFTYIDDIIIGIEACLFLEKPAAIKAKHRVLNIGNNQPEKLEYLITLLENALDKKAVRNYLPMQTGDVQATFADIEPFVQLTGQRPKTSLQSGIDQFIHWYQETYR